MYDFNNEEMSVLLVSLVGRRENIIGLLNIPKMSESFYKGYNQEMRVVESMMEKFFPGSVERIKAASAAWIVKE